LLILSLIASILSGLDYGYKNRWLLHFKKSGREK
jgi:hypothetical protein